MHLLLVAMHFATSIASRLHGLRHGGGQPRRDGLTVVAHHKDGVEFMSEVNQIALQKKDIDTTDAWEASDKHENNGSCRNNDK